MSPRRVSTRHARCGMTLAEVTVMAVVFSLFSTTVLASLTLALRYWSSSNQRILAEQNVRVGMATMCAEIHQAIPNPNATLGYPSIPSTTPTGILSPAVNTTGTSIIFTEPNRANYNPTSASFDAEDPANYQRVRYYVISNALWRELRTYDSSGNATTTSAIVVSANTGGTLTLSVKTVSETKAKITMVAREGASQCILDTEVTTLGK